MKFEEEIMFQVTHTLILVIQVLAFIPYTGAFYRLIKKRFDVPTIIWIWTGLAMDVVMAILGSTSDLGGENHESPFKNPLFIAHMILASIGMFGFLLLVILIKIMHFSSGKKKEGSFPRMRRFTYMSSFVIYPCWVIGVCIAIANVLFDFY